ncbi:MAG TPA: hypothetical protein VFD66_07020 [Verrucomicrobiae bacterium]|nr:hypothetical protein [Verrucomicrobiae bacterium]
MGRNRRIDPAVAKAAAADMAAFDANLDADLKAREDERAAAAADKAEAERYRRDSRAAVAQCASINGHADAYRATFAIVRSDAPLPPATQPEPGARRWTEAEENEMHQEQVAARLARFGDKAGKHGALATTRVSVVLRVLKYGVYDSLQEMAVRNGTTVSALIIQASTILARVDPDRYHEAMTGLAQYGPKTHGA